MGIRSTLAAEVKTKGLIAVPAQVFSEIIASLSPGKIELSLKENTLIIKSGKNISRVQTLSPDDFPPFPEAGETKLEFSHEQIESILTQVPFAASKDETRPALTAVLFNLGETPEIVATDGFRLSVLKLKRSFPEQKFMVPAKSLIEIFRGLELENGVIFHLSSELQQLFFTTGEFEIFIRLVGEEFPPYNKIIPSEFELQIELSAADLLQQIKRACIFAKESSYIVTLEIKDNQLIVSASASAIGKHEGQMEVKVLSGSEGKISFNAQYLLDYLQQIKSEIIIMQMNDSLQPAQFSPALKSELRYIVMPFRLQEG